MTYQGETTMERSTGVGGVYSPSLSDWVLKRLATN